MLCMMDITWIFGDENIYTTHASIQLKGCIGVDSHFLDIVFIVRRIKLAQ